MKLWEAKVSCYMKTQKGKKTKQCEIRLKKDNPFNKDDIVLVGKKDDINQLEEELKKANSEVNDVLKKLVVASEVINKYKDVKEVQERLLTIYSKRGLWGRIKNETPEELEELEEAKDNLKRLEDGTPLVILNPAGEDEDKEE